VTSREIEVAPEGYVYVCLACGKMSRDKEGHEAISRGWDVSCSVNSQLCRKEELMFNEAGTSVLAFVPQRGDA